MGEPDLYVELRRLVLEDPRAARILFLEHFDANTPELGIFLARISAPADGRLRQLVANAVVFHTNKARVVEYLTRWQSAETDEFTRRAIQAALAGTDMAAHAVLPRQRGATSDAVTLNSLYRYVADRLRHKIRNAMLPAQAHARRLATLVAADQNPEVEIALARFNDSIANLGRIVEAVETDPGYFEERAVVLQDWLKSLNNDYSAKYSRVTLTISVQDEKSPIVWASNYLLEIVFWNIWINAQQEIGANCEILVSIREIGTLAELVVLDNGKGFPEKLKDVAFRQAFSSRDVSRGRGLLEIQEAVERLGGNIELVEITDGTLRIKISLPVYRNL